MKHLAFFLISFSLIGCGTINTPNDGVDAIYNTTSAVIKGESGKGNCSTGHPEDRNKCQKRSQATTNAISESIKKHRGDSGV